MPAIGPKGALMPSSVRAGAAITACRFLKRGADDSHAVHNTAATIIPLGISEMDQPTADKPCRYAHRSGELVELEAGAAIALDALLTSDGTGRGTTAATGNQYGAIARQAAAAAGDLICVEIRYGVAP